MKVHLKFFASVREQLGISSETLQLDDASISAFGVRQHLISRDAKWAAALSYEKVLRMAINQEMMHQDCILKDGDELAFFPPVTGG